MPEIGNNRGVLKPFWTTTDGDTVQLYQGDVLEVLRRLPSQSVQCVVTSPPYWGLRDYGTGTWEGGDPNCSHKISTVSDLSRLKDSPHAPVAGWTTRDATIRLNSGHKGQAAHKEGYKSPFRGTVTGSAYLNQGNMTSGNIYARNCPLGCGARCVDMQLGSESRPDCLGWARGENCAERDWASGCHVCRMVLVFRELRRVLRNDGTFWLNYGDSYASGNTGGNVGGTNHPAGHTGDKYRMLSNPLKSPLPSGNLVGIPWRVALALQADGWILRQDIIWQKPSPMPESVKNRCTKAHEYIFLFAKRSGYFCDMEAIKEKSVDPEFLIGHRDSGYSSGLIKQEGGVMGFASTRGFGDIELGKCYPNRNKRSVWRISSQGYAGAHFATFPEELPRLCIFAGTSEHGCCVECGAPWKRVTEETPITRDRPNEYVKRKPHGEGLQPKDIALLESDSGYDDHRTRVGLRSMNSCANTVAGVNVKTVGWEPTCECFGKFVKRKVRTERRVDDSASNKNNQRIQERLHSTKSTLATFKTADSHQEDYEATITEYVSDLPLDEHPIRPCVVLDPFIGSGTTCAVALVHGRNSIGIDLSHEYLTKNAIARIEGVILSRPSMAHLVHRPRTDALKGKGRSVRGN